MRGGQFKKTPPLSSRGERLQKRILGRFGSLRAFSQVSHIAHPTLWRLFTVTDGLRPRESVLRALEKTLGVPYDDLLRDFGPTHETVMRRPGQMCIVCGERPQSKGSNTDTCGWACSTLRRLRPRIRTDLGRLVWAVMALANGAPPDRIAKLIDPPPPFDAVTDQTALRRTVAEFREQLSRQPQDLLSVTAHVLEVGYETLREHLLTGLYRRRGRTRAVPVRFTGTLHVAPKLGLTEAAYLRLGERAGTAGAFAKKNLAEQREPKKLDRCDTVREVVIRRHHGASSDEIIGLLEKRGIAWVAFLKQIPEFLAQHARRCAHCRPGVVYDLRVSGMSTPDVADLMGVSERTVRSDRQRGNYFIHQWESRLRIWPDLPLPPRPPEVPV